MLDPTTRYRNTLHKIFHEISYCLLNHPKDSLLNLTKFVEEKSFDEDSGVFYDDDFLDVVESLDASECLDLMYNIQQELKGILELRKTAKNRMLKRGEV